jgi:hypothetical protein
MKTDHDSFLAFYLTHDDEPAVTFKETRFTVAPYEVPEAEEVMSCGSPFVIRYSVFFHVGNNIPFRKRLRDSQS